MLCTAIINGCPNREITIRNSKAFCSQLHSEEPHHVYGYPAGSSPVAQTSVSFRPATKTVTHGMPLAHLTEVACLSSWTWICLEMTLEVYIKKNLFWQEKTWGDKKSSWSRVLQISPHTIRVSLRKWVLFTVFCDYAQQTLVMYSSHLFSQNLLQWMPPLSCTAAKARDEMDFFTGLAHFKPRAYG